jgi:hypothetical protein
VLDTFHMARLGLAAVDQVRCRIQRAQTATGAAPVIRPTGSIGYYAGLQTTTPSGLADQSTATTVSGVEPHYGLDKSSCCARRVSMMSHQTQVATAYFFPGSPLPYRH